MPSPHRPSVFSSDGKAAVMRRRGVVAFVMDPDDDLSLEGEGLKWLAAAPYVLSTIPPVRPPSGREGERGVGTPVFRARR